MVSIQQVEGALDALAEEYSLQGHCYDELASQVMSEFDALKWVTLCSQRIALRQREIEAMSGNASCVSVPSRFLGIYEEKHPTELENVEDTLRELAA
jgi:hypothetical protein